MEDPTDQAARLNRRTWDAIRRRRDEGADSLRHDAAATLLAGKTCLYPEQRTLAGDVTGKRLLDIGCGDGCELLEWARAGAQVVGIDNSPLQIEAAQRAAQVLGLSCDLLVADLLHLPNALLQGEFDLVYSSFVTVWIGNLDAWFRTVSLALKPGGVFVFSSGHPLTRFASAMQQGDATRESYFMEGPFLFDAGEPFETMQWYHTLSRLVTAVAQAGLHISHLLESEDQEWDSYMPGYPSVFHLRATKEKGDRP